MRKHEQPQPARFAHKQHLKALCSAVTPHYQHTVEKKFELFFVGIMHTVKAPRAAGSLLRVKKNVLPQN
jgi:hypothetical protein